MKQILFVAMLLTTLNVKATIEHPINIESSQQLTQQAGDIAVKFMNYYCKTNSLPKNLVTANLINAKNKREKEMLKTSGIIDYDIIIDGQDHSNLYVVKKILKKEGNAIFFLLKGAKNSNWPEFEVTVKVIKEGSKWLVDGSGEVNIPKSLRAER